MNVISYFKKSQIPLWVNIMQMVLILIMLGQVYMYFFDHQMMLASGIAVESAPMFNLVYEMGARLGVIAFASVFVLFTQDVKQYLVVLFMNIIREGQETIIDPMYPLLNTPMSPTADFWIHIVIVTIEICAFVVVYNISKQKYSKSES